MKVFKNSSPFIIWTLQRTGGTNLAKQLIERSGLIEEIKLASASGNCPDWLTAIDSQWKLHEPFNMGVEGRVFGKITEEWMGSKDKKALESAIGAICERRVPLKHCVEMVPWEVSAALAKVSAQHGYRHLFLRRDNATNRLLSLHFAKLSGVWGRQFLGECELREKIFSHPLPVSDLAEHEARCIERLGQIWKLLHSLGVDPLTVRFEDIYEAADHELALQSVLSILEYLDLSEHGDGNRNFVQDVLESGEQGTRNEYGNFKGIRALDAALKKIKRPAFASRLYPVEISKECESLPQIVHASLDLHPKNVHPGLGFDVGGVLVVKEALLEQAGIYALTEFGERRVQWGIPSPAIAKLYESRTNSASARFKLNGVRCKAGSSIDFVLRYGSGAALPLFRLQVASNATYIVNRNSQSC